VETARRFCRFLGFGCLHVSNDRHYQILQIIRRLLMLKRPAARIPLGANVSSGLSDPSKKKDYREALGIGDQELLFVRFGILHDIYTA